METIVHTEQLYNYTLSETESEEEGRTIERYAVSLSFEGELLRFLMRKAKLEIKL